jgi:PAS domain S-box-containing protein
LSAQRLLWTSSSHFEIAEFCFYSALSHAASWDSASSGQRRQHFEALAAHYTQLEIWAANSPENFENRAALVGAEIARIEGRDRDAMRRYEQAIHSAHANGFVQNEALANEVAARFYTGHGLEQVARLYLRNARACYLRWGAAGKVKHLDELFPHLSEEEPTLGPTSTMGAPVEHLDLATVIKVSLAVSGEIVLEKLLDTLMRTAMAQAGAGRVLLILAQGASQRIVAEATTSGDTVTVHLCDEAVAGTELPESVLHYVLRTRESVILDDAAAQSPFFADPYIRQRQARSVLCLPLLNRAKLIGVLYLENNLAPRVFAPARLAVLKLLASQAAISLENTHLYRDLAEREAKVRRLVEANIIGIFIFDLEGRIVEANDAFLQMVGYDREDFVAGRVRWADLTPPEWRDRHERAVIELKRTGTVQPYEREYFRKDGSRVPALIGSAAFDEQRDRGVAFVLDLTERKRAEEVARRSEKELRDVVNAVPAFVWSMLPDGPIDFVNDRWLEFMGLSPGDELGWNWEAVVHPDDRSRAVAEWREALKNGRPAEGEMRVRRVDGKYRWWFFRNVPLFDEAGNISKWYGTGIDIDDRKRTESLLAVEKRILEMVAKGDSLSEILDSICRLVEEQADGVLASILLLDGDRLRHGGAPSLPKAFTDAIDGAVIGPFAGSCGTAAYRGQSVIVEDIATDPVWADYRDLALPHSLRACWSTPVFTSQGKVIATFAMYFREPRRPAESNQEFIDQITHLAGVAIQQRMAQEKLQRSEAYLAEAEKLTHTGSWVWDPRSQKVRHCSEEMFRIFGLDPRVSLPTRETFRRQIHPGDRDWVNQKFEKALREKVDSFAEYRVLLSDGTVRHINALGHPVLDKDGELIEFVGTAIDVTERKRAELERRRLASLVEQAADLMAIADLSEGTPIYLNEAGLKMVGFDNWEEAKARRGIHYIFPEDRQFVNDVLWPTVLEKGSWSGEMRFRHFKTGDPIPILYSAFRIDDPETGRPVNIGNVCRDITDRKRAEEELRASEKRLLDAQMELARVTRVTMLGELTASIAHEVNQPLGAVVNAAAACRRWLDSNTPNLDEARVALDWIIKEGNRAGEVIRRVRALAKKTDLERAPLDVNDVVREALALVQRELTSRAVSLRLELASALPSILGDRVQLQQVIINLVMNGIEAMQSVTDRPPELVIQSRQDGTQQVLVSVTDCGVGFSGKDADRLFNAFFTTKASGMGMGLSICRSIIEAHGGRLWATANVPDGATFQFTIPWQAA